MRTQERAGLTISTAKMAACFIGTLTALVCVRLAMGQQTTLATGSPPLANRRRRRQTLLPQPASESAAAVVPCWEQQA